MMQRQGQVHMHKVKSHVSEDDGQPLHLTWGNECADHHAKTCARKHQISLSEQKETESVDAEAWLIQQRILAVLEQLPKIHRDRDAVQSNRPPKRTTYQTKLEQQGHHFLTRPSSLTPYTCVLCGQQWSHQLAKHLIPYKCPGPSKWGEPQGNRPWKLGPGQQVLLGTQVTCGVHALYWYKGLLFCMRCGHYAIIPKRTKSRMDRLAGGSVVTSRAYKERTLRAIRTDKATHLGMASWPHGLSLTMCPHSSKDRTPVQQDCYKAMHYMIQFHLSVNHTLGTGLFQLLAIILIVFLTLYSCFYL